MTTVEAGAPLVSIAMPFRNSERTLAEAIRSILLQTFQDWELLLCDDGSSDDSLSVAAAFSDPRIILWSDGFFKTLGARLNECIDRARGVYFARMDADDICYPGRIAAQVQFMKENRGVDLVGTAMAVFGKGGVCIGKRRGPELHAHICHTPTLGFPIFHPTWLGKLSWFRRQRYNPEAFRCEDQDLLLRAHCDSTYANLSEILLGYREETLDLEKIAASRRNWYRCVGVYAGGGLGGLTRKAVTGSALLSKMALDYFAVATGLRYILLRQRATAASAGEQARWESVRLKVQNESLVERPHECVHE